MTAHGFIAEPIERWGLGPYLSQLALDPNPHSAQPDVIVSVADDEAGSGTYFDGMRIRHAAYDVVERIRSLPDRTLLPDGVRARTLPVVLPKYAAGFGYLGHAHQKKRWRWYHEVEVPNGLTKSTESAIREWRRDLADELRYAGLAITRDRSGTFYVGRAFLRSPQEGEMLGAPATVGSQQFSWYLMPDDVLVTDVPALLQLEDLLNTYQERARLSGKKGETIFQEYFDDPSHAHMLHLGLFAANHSKVGIPVRGADPLVPDYVQTPRPLSMLAGRGGVLDLKTPDAPLLAGSKYRRRFASKVFDAIAQLKQYRELIDDNDTATMAVIQRRLGFVPRSPALTVVIGMRSQYDPDDLRTVEKRFQLDVRLVTYDDVINIEARRIFLQHRLAGGDV